MLDYLPDDLWIKILLLLPVKSLVRLSCVCKSWNTIITGSDFIHIHLDQTRVSALNDNTNRLVLLRYCVGSSDANERYSLRIDNDALDPYKNIDFPFQTLMDDDYFRILGYCNGLICLADDCIYAQTEYVLWNPSIGKYTFLPFPYLSCDLADSYDEVFGFGFDSRSNDYKIVTLLFSRWASDMPPRVYLFKLSIGVWETISTTIDPCYRLPCHTSDPLFLNGSVHWHLCGSDARDEIISFDVSDETFHKIILPNRCDEPEDYAHLSIALCDGCLSIIYYHDDLRTVQYVMKEIWVMKEYGVVESWTRLYKVTVFGVQKPIRLKMNGDMLLALTNTELASLDAKLHYIKYVGICESKSKRGGSSFFMGTYEESLVLFGHGNSLEKDTNVCKEGTDKIKRSRRTVKLLSHMVICEAARISDESSSDEESVELNGFRWCV